MFIDKILLTIQAGNGGNGCESYFRRTDRKIVPNGGDGGNGGRVIFRSAAGAPPLAHFCSKRHLAAEPGGHGGSNRKRGRNGRDLIVGVPPGTRLYDAGRGLLIRERMREGEEVTVVEGGQGGVGNAGGKKATSGEKKPLLELEVSLFIPADVFFVGLPGAGKSRLMNRLTRAHLTEADYPFATKKPEIAVYRTPDGASLTLCEMPSLYRGSHEGRGVGNDFLKHLERARLILYVLDPRSRFANTLDEGLSILREEVALYREDFLKIPSAILVNKMDLLETAEKKRIKAPRLKNAPVFFVSGTDEIPEKLVELLRKVAEDKNHA